jgi:hypothetical protein
MSFEDCWFEFQNLFGGNTIEETRIADWIDAWETVFDAASHHDPMFTPARKNYYLKCFLSFIDMGIADEIAWTLISTWGKAFQVLSDINEEGPYREEWESTLEHFRLSPQNRVERSDELEHYLDHVEEILEVWE